MKAANNTGWCQLIFSDTDAAFRGGIGYEHQNNYMAFYTGAQSEALRIDSSGNLLINATSNNGASNAGQTPVLYANGYCNFGGLRVKGGDDGNTIYKDGGDLCLVTASAHSIILKTNGGEQIKANNDGRVITTTNQSVVGLIVKNSSHDSRLQIYAEAANKNSTIWFGDAADDDIGIIDYDHNNNNLSFTVNAATRMWFDSSNGLYVTGTSHSNLEIRSNSASTKAIIQTVQDSDVRIGATTNHPLALYAGTVERVRIAADGDVGIGYDAPRAKLDVRGNVLIGDDVGSTIPSTFPASNVQLMVYTSTNGQPIVNTDCARILIATDAKQTGAQGYNGALDFGNSDASASSGANEYNWRVASIMSRAGGDTSSSIADGDLQFFTKTSSGSLTERVRIRDSGNMVSNHAIYGKYQVCQVRRGSDVSTGNQTNTTSMTEVHSSYRTNITLLSNNPYIRMTWVCNGEMDSTWSRTAMRWYYQINSSGSWYAFGRPHWIGSPADQNIEQACEQSIIHMEQITRNAGTTLTITPYWSSEGSNQGNINFGQTWVAFGNVPMASYLILEEISSADGGI